MSTTPNTAPRGVHGATRASAPADVCGVSVGATPVLGSGYEHYMPDVWADPSLASASPAATPIFHVGRVQYAFSAPLAQMQAVANQLTMLLVPHSEALRIVRVSLDDPQHTLEAELPLGRPRGRADTPAPRLYVDPSAAHVLISVSGDNYYWTPGWTRAQQLPRLAGMAISSVAWLATAPVSGAYTLPQPAVHARWVASGHVLLGTESGALIETFLAAQVSNGSSGVDLLERIARFGSSENFATPDRFAQHVHTLDGAVTGLAVALGVHDATVIATTPIRLHEFRGPIGRTDSPSVFARLFAPYRGPGVTSLRTELPGRREHSALVVRHVPTLSGEETSVAWLTDAGVFVATLDAHKDPALGHADMVPLPAAPPRALLRTDWCIVFALDNTVQCTRVLDHHVVFTTQLALAHDERIIGATADASGRTYWVYTDASIFELIVTDEARDVWRVCVDRGDYAHALAFAKGAEQTEVVHAQHGEHLLAHGRFIEAARELAHTGGSFESVALRFIDAHADDALREYVALRLDRTHGRTQRLALATWLVDMSLAHLNAVDAAGDDARDAAAGLRGLLATHRTALDPKTTLALIARHGRTDIWYHYARLIGDHEAIVSRLISERRWDAAIAALGQQDSPHLYYRFAGILMRHAPAAVTEAWIRNDALDVRSLIPALLQHVPTGEINHSILFLEHAARKCTDPAVHNLLLTRLAERAEADTVASAPLLAFIDAHASRSAHFDPAYALRICVRKGLREACVRLYAVMHLYEDAVDLSLQAGDIDMACRCAERAENTAAQKELWLKIAQFVVRTQDMHAAMAFLRRTPLLTIEDILPFFPDFSVIDDVKTDVCDTLENYVARIDSLKRDMERMTLTADQIQDDIQALSNRFLLVDPEQCCIQCATPLSQRHLYIFPCHHAFHADCLVTEVTRHLPPRLLRRLLQLQEELATLKGTPEESVPDPATTGQGPGFPVTTALSSTARVGASVASGLGSLKLDRLREHVRPEAIVEAISSGLSASMASGRRVLAPLDPFAEPRIRQRHAAHVQAQAQAQAQVGAPDASTLAKADALRTELNTIVAGACPVCTLSVQQLTLPFVQGDDDLDDDDWAI